MDFGKRIGDLPELTTASSGDSVEVSLSGSAGSRRLTVINLLLSLVALFGYYALQPGETSVVSKLYPFGHAKRYGVVLDGVTDNTTLLQNALNSGAQRVAIPKGTCGILSHFVIPAGVELAGEGSIQALPGFTDNYMCLMSTGSRISVRVIDGTGCPAPTGAWTGGGIGTARSPVGCAVFINGASGANIPDCSICVDTVQNFPSGPICAFSADNLVVDVRKFTNVQSYTGGETNGVVTTFDSASVLYKPGVIDGYKWKGWYFGRCTSSFGVCNQAKNGVNGQASHYDGSGFNNAFLLPSQSGAGYGYKAFESARPSVIGMTSTGSSGGAVFFDTCTDYLLDGLKAVDTGSAAICIQSDTGPTLRGTIRNWKVTRTVQGSTVNHIAITIIGNASYAIDGLDIDAGSGDNCLWGLNAPATAGAVVSNIRIGEGVRWTNNAQYDVIGYFQSIDISGTITRSVASSSGSDVFIGSQSGVAGKRCRIGNLSVEMSGASETAVEISGTWDTVTAEGLKTRGGGFPLVLDAGSSVSNLNLSFVHGFNAAQFNAITLNFSTATTTKLTVGNVQLPISGGGARTLNVAVSGSAVVGGYGVQTLADASTVLVDASMLASPRGACAVTLSGNRTMGAPSNARPGQQIIITVIQDGTGGRTLAWNAAYKVSWSDTGNTAGKRSTVEFVYDGTTFNQVGAQSPYA